MTTIPSSSAAAQSMGAHKTGAHTPRLLDRISAQQQAGSLGAADADALTSAVQDIDQTLSGSSGTSGGLDPSQAGSRMDDLIGAEVDKGTLTSDQATTLKSMLSSHGAGGHGHHGGTPPSGTTEAAAPGVPDAASSAMGGSDLLASFLQQLQGAQGQAQASGYGETGSGSAAATSPAKVFDFKA